MCSVRHIHRDIGSHGLLESTIYKLCHKSGPPSRRAARTADAAHSVLPEKRQNKHRQQQKNHPGGSSQLDQCVFKTGKLELEWHVHRTVGTCHTVMDVVNCLFFCSTCWAAIVMLRLQGSNAHLLSSQPSLTCEIAQPERSCRMLRFLQNYPAASSHKPILTFGIQGWIYFLHGCCGWN